VTIADLGLRIADRATTAQSAIHNPQSAIAWRLFLDSAGRPGAENMAIDEALLRDAAATGAAWLRLYRWAPPCLSLGRNEPALDLYDRAAIERRGMDVVRRPTGGRAVWHEHEVTYAVAAPIAAFGSLRAAYRTTHERLAAALQALGLDVELAAERQPAHPPVRPTACFSSAAGGEILVRGRKLVGSAQVRLGAAFLQHGSILLHGSQDAVRAVSRQLTANSQHLTANSGETTLSAALGRPVSFDEVATAIVGSWGDRLTPSVPVRLRPSPSVFSDPAWTWRR
jgi:lipoate-protein ligase A